MRIWKIQRKMWDSLKAKGTFRYRKIYIMKFPEPKSL